MAGDRVVGQTEEKWHESGPSPGSGTDAVSLWAISLLCENPSLPCLPPGLTGLVQEGLNSTSALKSLRFQEGSDQNEDGDSGWDTWASVLWT